MKHSELTNSLFGFDRTADVFVRIDDGYFHTSAVRVEEDKLVIVCDYEVGYKPGDKSSVGDK